MTVDTILPAVPPSAEAGVATDSPPLAHPGIIDLYQKDVDRTLLRENLKLTPAQRLAKLESAHRSLVMLRTARPVVRRHSVPPATAAT